MFEELKKQTRRTWRNRLGRGVPQLSLL